MKNRQESQSPAVKTIRAVSLSAVEAVRVRCLKCGAVLQLPTRGAEKHFTARPLQCKVCQVQLSNQDPNDDDSPLHSLHDALTRLGKRREALEIELVLPGETETTAPDADA